MSSSIISATLSAGITLANGAQYNTPLTITNTGAVFDPDIGIYSASLATVENAGTVVGGVFAAIDLNAGGTVANIGSSALISGAPNGGDGVFFLTASGTVFNEGTIIAGDGDFNGAVVLGQGGYVANNGAAASIIGGDSGAGILIRHAPVTLQNSGTITGGKYGVFGLDGALTASNQGYINGGIYGIALEAGGDISNTGPAATISGGKVGIASYYAPVTLINGGDIAGGTGIYIDDTTNGTSIIDVSGGGITGSNGVAISVASGTLDLTLAPEAVITGLVEATGTGNVLDLASGSTAGSITGIGISFTGFDNLMLDAGATWSLSGLTNGFDGGMITGFTGTDQIDITDLNITTAETLYANGDGVLAIPDANAAGGMLDITFSGIGTATGFILSPDNHGGADATLCYLRGTRILTPTGEVPIESIAIGGLLVTRFNGFQKVKWIGRQSRAPRTPAERREHAPVQIRAGALGENLPARDLSVSPGHSVLVDGNLLLAKLLVNGVTVTQDLVSPLPIEYFQVEFETHDCISAEGAWSESFADAPALRDAFDNAAEHAALYPEYRPPEEIARCAPRPEKGAKLDAALRLIVARAASAVPPGALHGWVDLVRAPWTVEGWAWDEANPELPVLLEALLDGQLIGTILSCTYRQDLEEAGFGAGRCAFFWTAPVTLPADAAERLHLRRASDGAALPGSASLSALATGKPSLRLVG